jgi:LmbE family N-acetylglucosaminyl deacetylase
MPLGRLLFTATTVLALSGTAGLDAQSAVVGPDGYDGAAATGLALRRLGTTARVLHIAAHPDDENTALFAPLALGRGIDAAYLSLTRGEGGQNGIGPELGVPLGVIRSEELLAARRLDGGDQFFARAIDYGYSRNAEEAFRHWPRDTILADVVAVIREYRPDVVASVWSGTPRDGHGQHQAAGILAREAVLAAGDPARFPEQIEAGLRPHRPTLYYRSSWFSDDPPDVELNTGELDPLLGASYHQIAMASRSRHRSQDQGMSLEPGPRRTAFDRVDPAAPVEVAESRAFGRYGDGAPEIHESMFAGVDTLLSQRAATAAEAAGGDRARLESVGERLRDYERLVREARTGYDALAPWRLLPTLGAAMDRLLAADRELGDPDAGALLDLRFHLREELGDLRDAVVHAANVKLDAVADEEMVVPGQTFRLEVSAWNGGPAPVLARLAPSLPDGWVARVEEGSRDVRVEPGSRAVASYTVEVPGDAAPTMPYYLDPEDPAPEDVYRWPDDTALRGLPFAPPPVRAEFVLEVPGLDGAVAAERDAAWVGVDRRAGEYRSPVKVVPAALVTLTPAVAVVPLDEPESLTFTVRLDSRARAGLDGTLRLQVPDGWEVTPADVPVRLEREGAGHTVVFRVMPPPGVQPGEHAVAAELEAGGQHYRMGYDVVDYPHIAPHHLYRSARARVRALPVRVADVRVGYIAGSGDGVPDALRQLGVAWEEIGAADLADGDFDRFDVIITGARAYEVRDDIVAHNQALLDWARAGGTLIVQYNKYPALDRDYAPWPVTIARPHGRVTDETAPVTILEPDHPVLTTPNAIGDADWEGWVQERGLYFWDTWEGPLTPLLAMNDPGEEPLTGSLLVAPLGQGTYVYTALALFRQLPEGVPGAYRLLANLISLGAE